MKQTGVRPKTDMLCVPRAQGKRAAGSFPGLGDLRSAENQAGDHDLIKLARENGTVIHHMWVSALIVGSQGGVFPLAHSSPSGRGCAIAAHTQTDGTKGTTGPVKRR